MNRMARDVATLFHRSPLFRRPWFASPVTLAAGLLVFAALSATFSYSVRYAIAQLGDSVRYASRQLERSWTRQLVFEELWWFSYVPFVLPIFSLARRFRVDSRRPPVSVVF